MKIIFPANNDEGLNSTRSSHFGKAKYYILVTSLQNGMSEVKAIKNEKNDNHSCGGAANKILSCNADALIVGGIGDRPAQIFKNEGLEVFMDTNSKTIKEALDLFLANKLTPLGDKGTCKS